MAFTGTPVVEKLSDRCFLITGASLAAAAAGTISLGTGAGEVDLGETDWGANAESTLVQRVKVDIEPAGAITVAPAVHVAKAGTTIADGLITLTNGGAGASGAMNIYVELVA